MYKDIVEYKMGKMFYLNYEECKLEQSYNRTDEEVSFILTMRNVNNYQDEGIEYGEVCFILTMRNVNYYMVYAMGENGQSFILTMRNVNQTYKEALLELVKVLS